MSLHIETVSVELLRAGPRHNQLVSPLTQYLAVCGNSPAGRVSLRYEHGEIERLLQELRYRIEDPDDTRRAGKVLDQLGHDVAVLLAAVPGLSGALDGQYGGESTLRHLRIVLSASELALLPFEASKLPVGEAAGSAWLAQRPRSPVCITRHIRSVAERGNSWPVRPRVLFISGPRTPHAEHEQALRDALAPWRDAADSVDKWLTVMKDATIDKICREVTRGAADGKGQYTHVHLLAHGTPFDPYDRNSPVGIELLGEIVSGKQLATALCFVDADGVRHPSVVTLATCDSGAVLDVRTVDASIAHDLHDQGITLVVASQFPLTIEGSVPLVAGLYPRLLRGDHPLVALYAVRSQLHSLLAHRNHDWAAVVAYEALPPDLESQLDDLRYWQARRAQAGALERLEALAEQAVKGQATTEAEWKDRLAPVDMSTADLPQSGAYLLECEGLRAAAQKRVALALLDGAVAGAPIGQLSGQVRERLVRSRGLYWRATQAFLGSWQEPGRKKANLHWLLGQVLALDVILGQSLDMGHLALARMAAETDLQSPHTGDRAWARVSLAEQALLQLGTSPTSTEERKHLADTCLGHLRQMLDLCGPTSEQATSTARQFRRYVDDLGAESRREPLTRLLGHFPDGWQGDAGLLATAREALIVLGDGAARTDALDASAPGDVTTRPAPPLAPGADVKAEPGPRSLRSRKTESASAMSIEMLSAANGDCLWLEYGDPRRPNRVLIDCGAKATAQVLASRIAALPTSQGQRRFELFVLTHVDADHINGALPLFEEPGASGWFDDVWFNGTPQMQRFLSVQQGDEFSRRLARAEDPLPWNRAFQASGAVLSPPVVIQASQPRTVQLPGGLKLTLLSPTERELMTMARKWQSALKELEPPATLGRAAAPLPDPDTVDLERHAREPVRRDPSAANGSSIALLAEFDGQSILLTGDAHAEVLTASIRALLVARGLGETRLPLTALKLSHHGSAHATTSELLSVIDCHHYLVSTNSTIFQHPDVAALARVVLDGGSQPTLYFNHRSERTSFWENEELQRRYGYRAVVPPAGQTGLWVDLSVKGRAQ